MRRLRRLGYRVSSRKDDYVLRVTFRGPHMTPAVLGSGETLRFGRSPEPSDGELDAEAQLHTTSLGLRECASHVSRLVGEVLVGEEIVRLRWHGTGEAQLSSLFDAPGGARRGTLAPGMTAMLDEGENQVLILRGRETQHGSYRDLLLSVDVEATGPEHLDPPAPAVADADASATAPAPTLAPRSREWFVALALAEPWLAGADDYPRPPSNREIYERTLAWHGYAWNLHRPQRVDDAIRSVSRLAFGADEDPFAAPGRVQNVRFAVGRRAAEVRLVTADDLAEVERERATRMVNPAEGTES